MLIIKKQANEFLSRFHCASNLSYFSFINELQRTTSVYKNMVYKLEFYQELIRVYNNCYQHHKLHCTEYLNSSCRFIKYYESTLFFLEEEIKYLIRKNAKNRISLKEKKQLTQLIDELADYIWNNNNYGNSVKTSLTEELNNLKELQLPNIRNYKQLLYGKLLDLHSERIITQTELNLIKAEIDDLFFPILRLNSYKKNTSYSFTKT